MQLSGLQFHLITDTRRTTAAGVMFPEHRHGFYELGVVRTGEARWHLSGRGDVALRAGEAMLVAPQQLHFEEARVDTGFAWIGFHAEEGMLEGVPLHRRIVFEPWWGELLEVIARLRDEDALHPPFHQERILLLLAELVILLKRAVAPAAHREKQERLERVARIDTGDRIEEARAYLERNAAKPLTMMQVARWHGWSLNHFEALFCARFGMPPKQFQQKCRLFKIEQRMRTGERSAKILAQEHGFQDSGYFCRWFKKQTGMTPSEYFERCAGRQGR